MSEIKYVKELLDTGAATEGQLLIPRKIHDTLIEEVDKALIPRSEAAMYIGPAMIPGSSYDLDLESENKMSVRLVAEGAEIWIDQDEYTSINIKPKKYGVTIKITGEMTEDAKWPLLERNIRKAGKRFAENETSLIITALDNAANTVSGGAAVTIANITRAMQYIEDADYAPTTLMVGSEFLNDLRNISTFVNASEFGSNEMLGTGTVGIIYGLNVLKFSTNAAPSSTYSKYGYVTDRDNAYCIVEKRPVSVENFSLAHFDMSGAAATQRIAVSYVRTNAIAKITTS
jgi:HK97 family phage major capsid protein